MSRAGDGGGSMPPEKHLGLSSFLRVPVPPVVPSPSVKGSTTGSTSGSKRKPTDDSTASEGSKSSHEIPQICRLAPSPSTPTLSCSSLREARRIPPSEQGPRRPSPAAACGMDCAKGTAVAGLHDDLMVDILSRIPVKDIRRSTCVSKPWRDLITDPLNRKKLPQTLEGFFHGGPCGDLTQTYGHFTSLSGRGESVPPVDPSFSFLTAKLPRVEVITLLDSCNGLLLFGCTREDKYWSPGHTFLWYIVCNPTTEQLVTVPTSSADERSALTFLMFNPAVSSHFHLVQIWESKSLDMMEVQTLCSYSSETRAWTDRSSKWKRGEKGGEWELWGEAFIQLRSGRALVSGLLHFLVYHVQKQESLIVAVDGEGKTCKIIGWHNKGEAIFIGQSQDHLHCIGKKYDTQGPGDLLSIWVLENYDTQEWILKHNVSSSHPFGFLSCPDKHYNIVAIHPDHNSIILVQHWNHKLVSYNMDSKELRALHTLGKGYLFLTPYVPWFMESSVLATKD